MPGKYHRLMPWSTILQRSNHKHGTNIGPGIGAFGVSFTGKRHSRKNQLDNIFFIKNYCSIIYTTYYLSQKYKFEFRIDQSVQD